MLEETKLYSIKSKNYNLADDELIDIETPQLEKQTKMEKTKPQLNKKKRGKGRESGTSSDEERWLDAIESGKLDVVDDELKKIKPKDPKLMTARQRAMYERGAKESSPGGEALLSLPSGYKEKVLTEEALQKAALKSQKRKQLADEKREKDKKRTMERLLKKQDTKVAKSSKTKSLKQSLPTIRYEQSIEKTLMSFPENFDGFLSEKKAPSRKEPIFCSINGCNNLKKYNCSKTNAPLCSFNCYKLNLKISKIK